MRVAALCAAVFVISVSLGMHSVGASSSLSSAQTLARGKMLVTYGACNDCHTPGWREQFGNVPVANWLVGSNIGFRGPWGTVYAANVRLRFFEITEQQWLDMVRTREGHPPMIWHDIRALSLDDQRAIYRFVRSLGKAGLPAPTGVPPQVEPKTPYFKLITPSS